MIDEEYLRLLLLSGMYTHREGGGGEERGEEEGGRGRGRERERGRKSERERERERVDEVYLRLVLLSGMGWLSVVGSLKI